MRLAELVLACLILNSNADGMFDVTAFGAKGDGLSYDTAAVRAAASALEAAQGGTLYFPAGESGNATYLTGFHVHTFLVVCFVLD